MTHPVRNGDGVTESVWRLGYGLDGRPGRGEMPFGDGIDGLIAIRNEGIVQSIQLYRVFQKDLNGLNLVYFTY